MTKKHFIALADALRGKNVPAETLEALVSFCKSQNPKFNEVRWLEYYRGNCGPSGGKKKVNRAA